MVIIATAKEMSASLSSNVSGADPLRDSLVKVSDHWFHWLIGMTILVAIGCALEIGESTIDWLEWWWHKKNKPFQEDKGHWTKPASIAGLLFVVVGVTGEGYFEARQSSAETQIRAYDEQGLRDATLKAGTAKDSADAAAKDAKFAKDELDKVKTEAGKLEHRTRALQPRFVLLEFGKKHVIEKLKPYAGQAVILESCSDPLKSFPPLPELAEFWEGEHPSGRLLI